jgi:hypothetical protein
MPSPIHLPIAAFLLALFCWVMPGPLLAQGGPKGFMETAPKAQLKEIKEKKTFKSPLCPQADASFTYNISFPTETGSKAIDDDILAYAKNFYNETISSKDSFSSIDVFCNSASGIQNQDTSWEAFRPSKGYLSILITESGYTGGAHEYVQYLTKNYNPNGSPMTVNDLFPKDTRSSLQKFYTYLHKAICSPPSPYWEQGTMPSFYGSTPCKGSPNNNAKKFASQVKNLSDIGNPVFTELGLTINLVPYDGWSWAAGPVSFDIPSKEMVSMGANPSNWEPSHNSIQD